MKIFPSEVLKNTINLRGLLNTSKFFGFSFSSIYSKIFEISLKTKKRNLEERMDSLNLVHEKKVVKRKKQSKITNFFTETEGSKAVKQEHETSVKT